MLTFDVWGGFPLGAGVVLDAVKAGMACAGAAAAGSQSLGAGEELVVTIDVGAKWPQRIRDLRSTH